MSLYRGHASSRDLLIAKIPRFVDFLEKQISGKYDFILVINMVFNPDLEKNQVIDNDDLRSIFKCSPRGGMRRSHKANTLVIISDHTKGFIQTYGLLGSFITLEWA
jgi:hypothetical protein